jgi:hypothetical protein
MTLDAVDRLREELRQEIRAGFAEARHQFDLVAGETSERLTAVEVAVRALGGRIDGAEATLGARIDGVETALGTRIDGVETALGARIDGVETALGTRIDGVETMLGARIDGVETALGTRIDAVASEGREHAERLAADNRRHFGVLVESMQTKVELVIEGVTMVDQKVDRLADEMRTELAKVDRRLVRVAARIRSREP